MKPIQTASQRFIAVKFDTTGSVDLKPLEVVKKLSIVVTPGTERGEVRHIELLHLVQTLTYCYLTYHHPSGNRIPLQPKCDERRCHQNNTGNKNCCEVKSSVPCERQLHFETAVVPWKGNSFQMLSRSDVVTCQLSITSRKTNFTRSFTLVRRYIFFLLNLSFVFETTDSPKTFWLLLKFILYVYCNQHNRVLFRRNENWQAEFKGQTASFSTTSIDQTVSKRFQTNFLK